jgi:large subunit ribosomal protein L24
MAAKIKKGDKVVVLSGRDKGKQGEVEQVLPKENRAVVGGINMAIRHVKQSQQNPQGGRIPKALPIDLSNLALLDANGKATRVGFRFDDQGNKVRYAKTTGDAI